MISHQKLGDLIEIRNGYLLRTKIEATPDGRFCLIQTSDFDSSRTVLDSSKLTRFEPSEMRKDQTVQPHEVLFLAKGIRNFAYRPGPLPFPTLAASYFYVLTPAPAVDPDYLVWFLNHPATALLFDRVAGVGARMPVIRKSDLADIAMPLPARPAQRKIVELHGLMAREAQLLEQLREKRKTFMDSLTMVFATQQGSKT